MDFSSSHIIIFNENRDALVVRRADNDEWEPGKLAIPGGKRENGETIMQNICRETMEEVGLTLNPKKIIFLPQLSKRLNHIFFTTNFFSGEVKLGDGEHSEYGWVNPRQLSEEDGVPNLQMELSEAAKVMFGLKIKVNG